MTKTVTATPADEFHVVANIIEWPLIMRLVKGVEVLTPGPIRAGTRPREHRVMFVVEGSDELEVATIDGPCRFRLLFGHPNLHYELDHLIDVVVGSRGSCRMVLIFRSRPAAPTGEVMQPLMTPFIEVNLRDELERDWSDLAGCGQAAQCGVAPRRTKAPARASSLITVNDGCGRATHSRRPITRADSRP